MIEALKRALTDLVHEVAHLLEQGQATRRAYPGSILILIVVAV
jgi:hypothetical protein